MTTCPARPPAGAARGAAARGYEGRLALTAHDARDAVRLLQAGVDRVLMPFVDASKSAAELLAETLTQQADSAAAG